MSDTPTKPPREFTAGETVKWECSFDDYSSADGWALKYFFRGKGKFDVSAEAQDDGSFAATVGADVEVQPGTYYWQGRVEKGGERYVIDSGEVLVKADLSGDVGEYDGRSEAKKTLDAIDAMLASKATRDQQEYQIGSRMLRRIPVDQLISLRRYYAGLYAKERRRAGGFFLQNIETRFDEPR